MTSDDFYDIFGKIDSDIIDFAEDYKFKKHSNAKPILRFGLFAAAIALVICLTPMRNLLNFIISGASSSEPETTIRDNSTPETAEIIGSYANYLIEASGNRAAKLTVNRAKNVLVVGMNATDDPLVYTIDANNSGWNVFILFTGNIDDFSFKFTDPDTGIPLEIECKTRIIDESEVEKYKNIAP